MRESTPKQLTSGDLTTARDLEKKLLEVADQRAPEPLARLSLALRSDLQSLLVLIQHGRPNSPTGRTLALSYAQHAASWVSSYRSAC